MIKRARGLPNRKNKNIDLAYWTNRNFNTKQNTSIQKMSGSTADHLAALHAIPSVTELHEKAVQWHHNKFNELMKIPSEQQLFSQILVAGGSSVLSPQDAAKLLHMYQNTKSSGGQ